MDSRKIVFRETGIVVIGQVICVAAMLGIFALLQKFDRSVLLGGITGGLMAVLNFFFFMAVCVSLAADKEEKQDVKGGQVLVRVSYLVRIAVLFLVFFACLKSGYFNLFALLLPLLFTRPVLTVAEFFRKSGEKKA